MAHIIQELSGKVLVIQLDYQRFVTAEDLQPLTDKFKQYGFEVIWMNK